MMKKIFYIQVLLLTIFSCISCASLQQLEINSLKRTLKEEYVYYDRLVEDGFDINSLDGITNASELKDKLSPYLIKDRRCIDNHFGILEAEGYFDTTSNIMLFDKRGTKDELQKQGYVLNKNMFYRPINGRADYQVGRFIVKTGLCLDDCFLKNFLVEKVTISHSKNILMLRPNYFQKEVLPTLDNFSQQLKKYDTAIIDLSTSRGGDVNVAKHLADIVSKHSDKRFYVLTTVATGSASEILVSRVQQLKNVVIIGTNTAGCTATGFCTDAARELYYPSLGIHASIPNWLPPDGRPDLESIGYMPDAWALNFDEMAKTISLYSKINYTEIYQLLNQPI